MQYIFCDVLDIPIRVYGWQLSRSENERTQPAWENFIIWLQRISAEIVSMATATRTAP